MAYNRTIQHFTSSQELATIWASGQNYIVNQLVLDSDKLYRCNTAHTSGATFAGDSAYWTGLNQGGIIDIAGGGTGQTTATAAFDALAPTTTAGDFIVYNGTDNIRLPVGSDGQTIIADSSQTNKLKWATIPQGNKNYITYSNFENNATTGWSLFNTTLTGKIPTGSILAGAASLNALAVSSSTPLAGSYSLSVTSPGAVAAGDGFITDVLTIDREDQAKVLTFSFYYEAVSGTMDFSGTSANTWAIYIHDGTSWIQPAGVYGMTQSSGAGLVTGTFQTNASGASYRLAVVCITATGAAVSIKFDDFKLGPQTAPIGPVMTDFRDMGPMTIGGSTSAPTKGTVVTDKVFVRREGDSARLRYYYQQSAASLNGGVGNYLFSLPAGMTFDSAKINITGALDNNIGAFGGRYGGGVDHYAGYACAVNSTQFIVYLQWQREGGTQNAGILGSGIGNLGAAGSMIFVIDVLAPIAGWSSNVQTSDSTDTRVVAASFYGNANYTSVSGAAIPMTNTSYDTHSALTLANGRFTAPVSGYYDVMLNAWARQTSIGNTILLYRNGSGYSALFAFNVAGHTHSAACGIYLNAGDYVDIRTDGAYVLLAGYNVSIARRSGPSVIAATENVIAKYSTTAGQAITTSPATVVYATREIDSHGIVNTITGDITIPISGKYLIGVYGSTASAAFTSGGQFLWQIRKNGSFSSFVNQIRAQTAYTGILESVGPTYISCLAGDIINIQAQSSTATTLRTAAGTNFFYLVRLGN